jgi:hypothetical protein
LKESYHDPQLPVIHKDLAQIRKRFLIFKTEKPSLLSLGKVKTQVGISSNVRWGIRVMVCATWQVGEEH